MLEVNAWLHNAHAGSVAGRGQPYQPFPLPEALLPATASAPAQNFSEGSLHAMTSHRCSAPAAPWVRGTGGVATTSCCSESVPATAAASRLLEAGWALGEAAEEEVGPEAAGAGRAAVSCVKAWQARGWWGGVCECRGERREREGREGEEGRRGAGGGRGGGRGTGRKGGGEGGIKSEYRITILAIWTYHIRHYCSTVLVIWTYNIWAYGRAYGIWTYHIWHYCITALVMHNKHGVEMQASRPPARSATCSIVKRSNGFSWTRPCSRHAAAAVSRARRLVSLT